MDRFRLDGKVAVVTGASSGLGVAFATALADAGCDLVLAARRSDRLHEVARAIETAGHRAVVVTADVVNPADCETVAETAITEFGRLDVLVNSAGKGGGAPSSREEPDHFRGIIDVNLMGAYWMSQSCGRRMTPGSSIVNIGSVLGTTTAGLPQAAYSASKAGLAGLTRDLAAQWSGRKGIRLNTVEPGFFDTEMSNLYPDGYQPKMVAQRVLLGRAGSLDECAAAVVFLASPASSYITGITLRVDGGMTIT